MHTSKPQFPELCDGVSLAFLQNKTFMQLSGEGWKCDSSALKWLYRKSYPTLCLRLLIFTAPLSGGEEVGAKGRVKSWSKFLTVGYGQCGVVLLQSLYSDHFLSVLMLNCKPSSCRSHSLISWVKNSYNLWSVPGLFPNRDGGRKRLVVPLLWIIHPILPAWVLSDPFAWLLLGLGRRAGCLPHLR